MSYQLLLPCYNCTKNQICKDGTKVADSVNEIHNSKDGSHQGSGSVIIQCVKIDAICK
jgi:hypothetical protein